MISVQAADFDVAVEYDALIADDLSAGAVVFFVGRVRELNLSRQVEGLTIEHYSGMTEKVLEQLVDDAKARWQITRVRVIHRIGELGLGDQIVLVGVTSPHREQAFEAAEFLMDFLKTQAPFWKKENYVDSKAEWLESNEKDQRQVDRWLNSQQDL